MKNPIFIILSCLFACLSIAFCVLFIVKMGDANKLDEENENLKKEIVELEEKVDELEEELEDLGFDAGAKNENDEADENVGNDVQTPVVDVDVLDGEAEMNDSAEASSIDTNYGSHVASNSIYTNQSPSAVEETDFDIDYVYDVLYFGMSKSAALLYYEGLGCTVTEDEYGSLTITDYNDTYDNEDYSITGNLPITYMSLDFSDSGLYYVYISSDIEDTSYSYVIWNNLVDKYGNEYTYAEDGYIGDVEYEWQTFEGGNLKSASFYYDKYSSGNDYILSFSDYSYS